MSMLIFEWFIFTSTMTNLDFENEIHDLWIKLLPSYFKMGSVYIWGLILWNIGFGITVSVKCKSWYSVKTFYDLELGMHNNEFIMQNMQKYVTIFKFCHCLRCEFTGYYKLVLIFEMYF